MFEDFKFLPNSNNECMIGKIPDELFLEIGTFVNHCAKVKDHPLGMLYNHLNYGLNTYQMSVPAPMVEQSFIFPYLIKLGEHYVRSRGYDISPYNRRVRFRSNADHFDKYDLWINFTEKGDENPRHNHAGSLSGVIYYSNDDQCPTCFEHRFEYIGQEKDIIIFPSTLYHSVNKHVSDKQRITLSFNLIILE